jgi:hypothetical protein
VPLYQHQTVVVDISRIIDHRGSASPEPSRVSPPVRPHLQDIQAQLGSTSSYNSSHQGSHHDSHHGSHHGSSGGLSTIPFGSSVTGRQDGSPLPTREADSYTHPAYFQAGSNQRMSESVSSPSHSQKRASLGTHPMEQPAKKQSKWSQDENRLIIQLRGENMKWEEISKRLLGRSAISCRLHYQNFLERKAEWTDEREAKLARLYDR